MCARYVAPRPESKVCCSLKKYSLKGLGHEINIFLKIKFN